MKKIEFDIESKKIQESLIKVCVSARVTMALVNGYKRDVKHIENDIAFSSLLTAYNEAMEALETIIKCGDNDVSFDDLIREVKPEE